MFTDAFGTHSHHDGARLQLQSSIRAATKTGGGPPRGLNARMTQNRPSLVREVDERDDHPAGQFPTLLAQRRCRLTRGHADAAPAPENSFIADSSFTRAPLNSRVPPVSPHRFAGKSRTSAASTATTQSDRVRRPRAAAPSQPRPEAADDEEDDVPDSGSVVEEEEVDEATRREREKEHRRRLGLEKEPLAGLNAELQEALISEDLLFVLTVSFGTRSRCRIPSRSDPCDYAAAGHRRPLHRVRPVVHTSGRLRAAAGRSVRHRPATW